KNINLDTLSNIRVPVPPLEEQIEIVRRLEAAMDWLSIVLSEQGKAAFLLGQLDQRIAAKAFRGELVPQDLQDEPADRLLERIRMSVPPSGSRRGRRSRVGVAA
ncbi:restriction endonuclease subunit S, partial [Roseomonas mucosa]